MTIASCTEIEKPVIIEPAEKIVTGIKTLITSPLQLESSTIITYDDRNQVAEAKPNMV